MEFFRKLLAGFFFLLVLGGCGGGGAGGGGPGLAILEIPFAPTNVTVVGGTNSIVVGWQPAQGAFQHNIYWSAVAGVNTQTGTKISNASSPTTIYGLSNGTTYYVIVTAENSAGESPASAQAQAEAELQRPARATGLSASPADGQATLRWDDQPDATSYTVVWNQINSITGGGSMPNVTNPYTVTGLTNGVRYRFTVAAVNDAGTGTASNHVEAMPVAPVSGWTGQTLISVPSSPIVHEVAINDSGVAAVTWTYNEPSGPRGVAVNHNASGSWAEPMLIAPNQSDTGSPSVAVTNNNDIFVAYLRSVETVWLRRYHDGIWSDPVLLNTFQPALQRTSVNLASDGQGNVFAAWRVALPGPGGSGFEQTSDQVWVRRFDATEDSWEPAQMISSSVRQVNSASLSIKASADNRAVLAWLQDTQPYDTNLDNGGPGRSVVFATVFDGMGWSPAAAIGQTDLVGEESVEYLAMDINSIGSAIVAGVQTRYPSGENPVYRVEAMRYDSQSGVWATPEIITEVTLRIVRPNTAIDDADRSIVAWRPLVLGNEDDRVEASIYDTGVAAWDPVHTVLSARNLGTHLDFEVEKEITGANVLVFISGGLHVLRSDDGSSSWGNIVLLGGQSNSSFDYTMSTGGWGIVAVNGGYLFDPLQRGVFVSIHTP